jgi:Bacterial Ig domain
VRPAVIAVILGIMLSLVLPGCSSDKQGDLGARTDRVQGEKGGAEKGGQRGNAGEARESLEISPADPTLKSTLTLVSKGMNLAGAKAEWIVNGMTVPGAEGLSFKADGTAKGDTVQAKVTVQGREVLSNIVEIKNAPPELTKVKLMPEVFKPGDRLGVDVSAEDPDGDKVTVRYEWTKNGEPAGDGREIEGQVRRGDKVEVRIAPFDGEVEGTPVILKREINNMPPMIGEGGRFNFDGRVCTYQVKATDPDGDPLTYYLKNAPSGMTVDPETGAIRWEVPQDFGGKVSFTAVVKDGRGGESEQNLSFIINKQ